MGGRRGRREREKEGGRGRKEREKGEVRREEREVRETYNHITFSIINAVLGGAGGDESLEGPPVPPSHYHAVDLVVVCCSA